MRAVLISELRRGDFVYCEQDRYKVYSDPVQVAGVWTVETTSGGEYAVDFKDGDELFSRPPVGNMLHGSSWDRPTRFDE